MKKYSLERIKRISSGIISDDEWVNDSHTRSEHNGIMYGLSRLIDHLTRLENE